MKQISFIHAADLHLDSPMTGLKHLPAAVFKRVRESTFSSLSKLTKAAIEREVDFVILAGDLFDGADRSLRAQSKLRSEMVKLEANNIPVYVVHGNHDHLGGTWVSLDFPANVHIFANDVEVKTLQTKLGAAVNLYGFSYHQRHIYDRKINDYQKQEGVDFHIGILHGNEGGNNEHGNYAPFYLKELLEKQFDYWALGHIHKREILSEYPPVVYPGNLQGRNKKEEGAKGFYHVRLTDADAKLEFIEAADVIWEEAVIDAKGAGSFQKILTLCKAETDRHRKVSCATLLTIELCNVQLEDKREKRGLDEELLELLQEEEQEEARFVWPVAIKMNEMVHKDKEQLKAEGEFYKELFETAEEFDDTKQALALLYEHQLGRKYLSFLSEAEQQQLRQQAESLLIKLLYPI
jgi:exonuclease SbcD